MNPYNAPLLPLEYKLDNEMKILLKDVYFKYGEYKYALRTLKTDYKYFLDLMLFTDTLCTSNIEFQKLSLDDMFYMKYFKDEAKVKLIDNLRRAFIYAYKYIKTNEKFDINFYNKMNKVILKKTKTPSNEIGVLRKSPAYVMKLGLVGRNIDYMAPNPKELKKLMKNFIEYINESNDEPFIKMAVSHYQFLIIRPYVKGNGRIARLMIPMDFNKYFKEDPILFMSEIFKKNEISYRRVLNESRENGINNFIKFFLKSIIEMCEMNISKIEKINKVYEEDFEYIKEEVGGNLIYKIYPYIAKTVVFTINDIVKNLNIHINSANKVLARMVEVGVLIKEKRAGCNRVTYRYNKLFNIYTNKS